MKIKQQDKIGKTADETKNQESPDKVIDNRIQAIYQEGIKAYQNKDFEKAAAIFVKLTKIEKNSSLFSFFAGISLMVTHKIPSAIRYFNKVIDSKKNFHCTMKSCIFLAYIYIEKGKYEEAFQVLRIPVENNYHNPYAFSMMGYLAHLNEKYQEAEGYYKKCLDARPDHPGFNNNYGYNLLMLGKGFGESIPYLEKAVRKNKKSYAYLHSLGWALCLEERYEESLKILTQAWRLKKADIIKEHIDFVKKKLNDK